MLHAIRQKVTVRAGGRIEICVPGLAEGAHAEVIVIEDPEFHSLPRLTELIGQGRGAFASPEDVDAFLRREREEWG